MAAVVAVVFMAAVGAAVFMGVEVAGSVADTAVAAGALAVADTEAVTPVADIVAQAATPLGPGAVTPIARQAQMDIGQAANHVQAVAGSRPAILTSTTARPRSQMVNGIRSVVILAAGRPHRSAGKVQMAAPRRPVLANPRRPMGNGARSAAIELAARPLLEVGPAKATKSGPIKVAVLLQQRCGHAAPLLARAILPSIHRASTQTVSCSLDSEAAQPQ